jgi:hypothetical protein
VVKVTHPPPPHTPAFTRYQFSLIALLTASRE